MKRLWFLIVWLLCGVMLTLSVDAIDFAQKIKYSLSYTWNTDAEVFTAWIISIPNPDDPTKWFTIMDRNLWATTTWAWTNAGIESYGYYYQWWNNYGFHVTWDIENIQNYDEANIDATQYGPGNYYSSSIFIIWNTFWEWASVWNYNLRWGEDDTLQNNRWYDVENNRVINAENRQWPCPSWYHVPSVWEWDAFIKTWRTTNSGNYESWICNLTVEDGILSTLDCSDNKIWNDFFDEFKIPLAGYMYYDRTLGIIYDSWSMARFFPSSPSRFFETYPYVRYVLMDNQIDNQSLWVWWDWHKSVALPVRCFKNDYVPIKVSLTLKNDDSIVSTQDVIKWLTWTKPSDPELTWHTFKYWHLTWTDAEFDFTTPITWDTTLYAKFEVNQYTITFDTDWWSTIAPITWDYWTAITKPTDPTKNGYTFSWRETAIPDTMPAENLTIKAERTKDKASSGGSSWWGWMRKDSCPNGDLSPSYYDGECWSDNNTWNVIQSPDIGINSSDESSKDWTWNQLDSSDKSSEWQTWNQDEFLDAYNFAFKHGITTMDTIQKANLDWYMKRGHLAKMITNYAVNVLWKEIPLDIPSSCLSFNDEATVRESEEIKDYAIKSCALWLMWINMKNNEFLPNDYVTRAEFGTVLSRVLWWDKYNLVWSKEKPRYSAHLNALKEEWIMKMIDNPKMLEKRWYVMIMLMRSVK